MKLMDGFYNCFSTLHFAKLLLAQHNCLDSNDCNHCNHYVLRKDIEDHLAPSSFKRLCVSIAKLHSAEKIAGTQNIDQLGHDKASQEHGRNDKGSALVHVKCSSLCAVEFAYRSIILQEYVLRCCCVIGLLLIVSSSTVDFVHVLIRSANASSGPRTVRIDVVIKPREEKDTPRSVWRNLQLHLEIKLHPFKSKIV